MKVCALILTGIMVAGAVVIGHAQRPDSADDLTRAAAVRLFQSLTPEQKQAALLPFDHKDKSTEAFPAVTRPGVSFDKLTAEQKGMIDDVVRAMTSEYGARRCLEVAKQTPDSRGISPSSATRPRARRSPGASACII